MPEVYRVLPEQKQSDFSRQPEAERRQATGSSVVQFCGGAIPGSVVSQPYSETQQNATVMSVATTMEQTPEGRTTELKNNGIVYHTAQMRRGESSCVEEPLTKPELRTKERKVPLYESGDSTDEDVSEIQRHRKKKAETDAKVSATQHSPRRPNGTSKRAIDLADAKVSSTQHSPPKKSTSSLQDSRCKTSSRTSSDRRQSSTSRPRNTSTEERKCDNRKSPREARNAMNGSEESSAASSSEEEETIAAPKHILKPPKFDGQSSFETFVAQFSNCAEHNRWNDVQKLAYLRNSLEKEAAYVLWDYGKDAIGSLSGLMKILETRFGGKAVADKHRIELQNRRRRANETLQNVHSDIRRLAALAYPSVQPQMLEEITCDHFLDALGDPDFVLKSRQRQPADLDSALRIALQLEVWTEDMTRHRDASHQEKGGRRVREISHKKPPEATTTLEALHKEVERVKKFIEFDRGPPRNPNSGGFSSDRRPDLIRYTAPSVYHACRAPVSAPTTTWSSRGLNAAGYGQSPGTYHPSTSARPSNGMNRTGNFYRAPNPNSGCFYCGDPTHRARDCLVSSAEQ